MQLHWSQFLTDLGNYSIMKKERERERETETDRQRQTDRQTDRQRV